MRKSNDIVYHYCSVETFQSIIENRTLRLSDVTKSNDSMEIEWAKTQLLQAIEKKKSLLTDLSKLFDDETPDLRNSINQPENCTNFNEWSTLFAKELTEINCLFLACCFSNKTDDLSQWRGYASDATGVSIGFDSSILSKLCECVTTESQIHLLFRDIKYIDSASTAFNPLVKKVVCYLDEGKVPEKIARSLCNFLPRVLGIYKNSKFKSESEIRLLFEHALSDTKALDITLKDSNGNPHIFSISSLAYHAKNNNLIAYRDMHWPDTINLIKSIQIGPKCPLLQSTVYHFLITNGIKIDSNDITVSEATYR